MDKEKNLKNNNIAKNSENINNLPEELNEQIMLSQFTLVDINNNPILQAFINKVHK